MIFNSFERSPIVREQLSTVLDTLERFSTVWEQPSMIYDSLGTVIVGFQQFGELSIFLDSSLFLICGD